LPVWLLIELAIGFVLRVGRLSIDSPIFFDLHVLHRLLHGCPIAVVVRVMRLRGMHAATCFTCSMWTLLLTFVLSVEVPFRWRIILHGLVLLKPAFAPKSLKRKPAAPADEGVSK
jgi:hypothetical protein